MNRHMKNLNSDSLYFHTFFYTTDQKFVVSKIFERFLLTKAGFTLSKIQ